MSTDFFDRDKQIISFVEKIYLLCILKKRKFEEMAGSSTKWRCKFYQMKNNANWASLPVILEQWNGNIYEVEWKKKMLSMLNNGKWLLIQFNNV